MADHFTACLESDAATVIAILQAAPFKHRHIETLGPYTNGNVILNDYVTNGVPTGRGGSAQSGNKVLVHTQSD